MAKFDVNKIIEESLREASSKEVISEVEPLQVMKGWYGSKLYDRLHKTPTPEEALGEKRFQIARKYRGAVDSGDTEGARFARQQLKGIRSAAAPVDKEASSLLSQETARDAARDESTPRIRKGLVYGSDKYKKLAAEREIAGTPDAMKKAVEADELKKVSKISKAAAEDADVAMGKEATNAEIIAKKAMKKASEENEMSTASAASKAAAKEVDTAWNKEAADASELGRKALAKNTEDTTSVLSHLGKSARKVGDDIQSGVKSFGHKVADHLSNLDYGKTALAGGAIAAGLGALALRRRMKNAKRE